MQPFSGNQRPDLRTAPMKMSLVLRLPRKMHLCRSSSNVPRHRFWQCNKTLTFCSLLRRCTLRLPRETSSERPKVLRTWCVLYILTSKCASRHNGVHFFDIATSKSGPKLKCFVHFDFDFDISTSKSGPRMVCFVHFDLGMCLAPQRRAIFHLSSGQLAPDPPL